MNEQTEMTCLMGEAVTPLRDAAQRGGWGEEEETDGTV